jgi:hypothetical protein
MTDRLKTALERLERALTAQGNHVVKGLIPGLGEAEIRARVAEFGFEPHEDLITWFSWHNGYQLPVGDPVPDGLPGRIGPTLIPLDLELACVLFVENRDWDFELIAPGEEPKWFPVVRYSHAGEIVMYCGGDTSHRGQVAYWEAGFPEGFNRPSMLAEPVEWWIEYIETGVWSYDALRIGFNHPSIDRNDIPRDRRYSGMV